MRPATLILVIASLIFIVLSFAAVALFAIPLDAQRIEADIALDSRAAFKVTNDSFMHFGTIDLENTATRSILIENIRSAPIVATVYLDGPSWLSVSENRIRLMPEETREIVFTADPPDDTAYGHYLWNITVVYRRTIGI
jgi:hypothetical protein